MKLELDTQQYEKQQSIFVNHMVTEIMVKLREAGLEGLTLENTTAKIAFIMASSIDNTANIEADGVEVSPFLMFQTDEDQLIHCGENSNTYSYVTGALKRLFES